MKLCLIALGMLALAMVIVPPCIAFGAGTGLSDAMKTLMFIGSLLWFASATPISLLGQSVPADTHAKPLLH